MKQLLIFLILVLTVSGVFSQEGQFNWCTAFQGVQAEYIGAKPYPGGGLVALVGKGAYSFSYGGQEMFVQGGGRPYQANELLANRGGFAIMRLNGSGSVIWASAISDDVAEVLQLAVDEDGNTYLFVMIKAQDDALDDDEYEDENAKQYGYLFLRGSEQEDYLDQYHYDEGKPDKSLRFPVGAAIVKLNAGGAIVRVTTVKQLAENADLEVTSMHYYGEGNLLLGGFTDQGKLAENLSVEAHEGGGNFVLMIDSTGTPVWGDVVSYRLSSSLRTSDCGTEVDVAPNGTIYMGGTYFTGGVFSNGLQTLAPDEYTLRGSNLREAFVVSYNPKGKINWVSVDKSNSTFYDLLATDDGVYVSHNIKGALAFGSKVDTSNASFSALTKLNTKGKTVWNKMTNNNRLVCLERGYNETLVVAGKISNRITPIKWGKFSTKEEDDVFIITLDKNGEALDLWSANLWRSEVALKLIVTPTNNDTFLAFEAWCGQPGKLSSRNSNLPDVMCHGGAAVLGKIKR